MKFIQVDEPLGSIHKTKLCWPPFFTPVCFSLTQASGWRPKTYNQMMSNGILELSRKSFITTKFSLYFLTDVRFKFQNTGFMNGPKVPSTYMVFIWILNILAVVRVFHRTSLRFRKSYNFRFVKTTNCAWANHFTSTHSIISLLFRWFTYYSTDC